MASSNTFNAKDTLTVGDESYEIYRIDKVEGSKNLPYSLKVLLENQLRTEDGENGGSREFRRRRVGQNRLRAEQDRPLHPSRDQLQQRGREIRAIRIPEEHHPRGLEPIGGLRLLQEGGEGLGLEADVGLIEVLRPAGVRGDPPEPPRPSLLQAPPAQRQDRGPRRGANARARRGSSAKS